MEGLVSELKRKREAIGIPAQVWAEFMHAATPEEIERSHSLLKTTVFRFLPYDMRAAIETVEVSKAGQAARKALKGKLRERQAVKVDWQILAIAKVHNARLLLTNDDGMLKEAGRADVVCLKISDLAIPDDLRQHPLNLSTEEAEATASC